MRYLKIKQIKKIGRRLYIYFKVPYLGGFRKIEPQLRQFYDKESSLETFIDKTGKCAVIGYLLRNKEDILPYVKNKR